MHRVVERYIDELRETLLAENYDFGAPRAALSEVRSDGMPAEPVAEFAVAA